MGKWVLWCKRFRRLTSSRVKKWLKFSEQECKIVVITKNCCQAKLWLPQKLLPSKIMVTNLIDVTATELYCKWRFGCACFTSLCSKFGDTSQFWRHVAILATLLAPPRVIYWNIDRYVINSTDGATVDICIIPKIPFKNKKSNN